MSNITYIINSKEYGKKDFINKQLLLKYLFDRFPLEAVEKVENGKITSMEENIASLILIQKIVLL